MQPENNSCIRSGMVRSNAEAENTIRICRFIRSTPTQHMLLKAIIGRIMYTLKTVTVIVTKSIRQL